MSHSRSIATAFIVFSSCTVSAADKPIEFPLSSIWAYWMPGTQDVHELEPATFGARAQKLSPSVREDRYRKSWITRVMKVLNGPSDLQSQSSGLAVAGSAQEALRDAAAILGGESDVAELRPNERITIVFFARLSGEYIHLQSIGRRGHTITLGYSVVPHLSKELTSHFALIPVGPLEAGRWHVQIDQLPLDKKYAPYEMTREDLDAARQRVCQSFDFTISTAN